MTLSTELLREAHKGSTRVTFLRYISERLIAFTGCDRLEIRLAHGPMRYRWSTSVDSPQDYDFQVTMMSPSQAPVQGGTDEQTTSDFEVLCDAIMTGTGVHAGEDFARRGYFWSADTQIPVPLALDATGASPSGTLLIDTGFRSVVIVRLVAEGENVGLLILQKRTPDHWDPLDGDILRHVGDTLGLSATDRRAQAALRERIKELTCLYGIALTVARSDQPMETVLQGIAELLPPSWQFPEIACARITLDDTVICTRRFKEMKHSQRADIVVHGRLRGAVEVGYFGERPEFVEGPFLAEEKSLLDAVARQIVLVAERREDEHERSRLKAQLRHADRLATIGQLSAGVAHELNEPLSNILGYAQLALKCPGIPEQAARDIQKITKASLHAREVIRKLMLYARQTPPETRAVDLNRLVEEELEVFAARCEHSGITMLKRLAPSLTPITADSAQLNQVLVNLVVNAIQAMPAGGTLTVETRCADGQVVLAVEDTGVGMSADVLNKIFLPFFTTKDVDEGTGLGLAVVQGIVTAHGGTIAASSQLQRGSRFEVKLPVFPSSQSTSEDSHDQ